MSELRERIARELYEIELDRVVPSDSIRAPWETRDRVYQEGFFARADRILALLDEPEPVGRLIYEAKTGGGFSSYPRYTHGRSAVIPACHKVVPVYASPTPTPHTYSGGHCIRCDAPEECRPSGARTVGRAPEPKEEV